ncbi:MAG: 2-succinyl-6-hydroxy-2,4-cyclohexadiene-1-carboxylate synthase [Anaerolineales bacterium]|nr:2-succinyl-6-hydroxy-2,4-cyclohexadiene-1-carboxylate synthase [Anaerolineales bacterium]
MNHFDLGGDGEPLHFLHANGYPPECYQPLFERLQAQYRVFGMKLRPLWDGATPNPNGLKSWHPFSDDLLRFLSRRETDPVIGVGHSIGGIVTLRAAMREPKRFRALILLDPVFFIPPIMLMWKFALALGVADRVYLPTSAALKRRREFDELESVFQKYRRLPVFRFMSDAGLKDYINGITTPQEGGGFKLVYPPEWEAHIYRVSLNDFDLWRGLPKLNAPTLIIRGAETDTFLRSAERLVKIRNPKIRIHTMQNATHILPLEHPQETAEIMDDFISTLKRRP